MKFLKTLMSITLLLVLVNLYFTFNLYSDFRFTGKVVDESFNNKLDDLEEKIIGEKNASITIIEYSDFQCPFCGKFHKETFPKIEEKYIKTGMVKFVFKNFPLDFHQYAKKASEAAECANEQGKFKEYHDRLFENQNEIDVTSLKSYAKELGLDLAKFNLCFDSSKYANKVQQDLKEGIDNGISGTPTFIIDGTRLVGAQPYSAFEQIIEQKIKK